MQERRICMRKKQIFLGIFCLLLAGCKTTNDSSSPLISTKDPLDTALSTLQENYHLQGEMIIHYLSIGQQLDFSFEIKQTKNAWFKVGYDTYYENFIQLSLFKEEDLGVYKSLDFTNTLVKEEYIEWKYVSNPFLSLNKEQFFVDDGKYYLDLTLFDSPSSDFYAWTGNEHTYESIAFTFDDQANYTMTIQTKPEENSLGNLLSFEYHLTFKDVNQTKIEDIQAAPKQNHIELQEQLNSFASLNYSIRQEIVEGDYLGNVNDFTSLPRYQKLDYFYDDRTILCEYENQGVAFQEGYYVANNEWMYPFSGQQNELTLKSSEANTLKDLKPKYNQISPDFFIKEQNLYTVTQESFIQSLIPALYLDASFDYVFLSQAIELAFTFAEDTLYFFALFSLDGKLCTLRNTFYAINETDVRSHVNLDSFFTKEGFLICDLFIGTWQGELRDNLTGEYLGIIYTLTFSKTGVITINDEVYTIIDFQESMNEGGVYQIEGTLKCSFYYQKLPQREEELILTTDDLQYQIKMTRVI